MQDLLEFQEALRALNRLNADFLASLPVTDSGYQALAVIRGCDESAGLTMTELAEKLSSKPSSATELVDRLVKRGLVTRESNSCDRRLSIVQLTRKGQQLVDRARQEHLRHLKEHRRRVKALVATLQADLDALFNSEPEGTFLRSMDKYAAGAGLGGGWQSRMT